ncbi:31592_t:CDS:1, partial [Racocetra persica]
LEKDNRHEFTLAYTKVILKVLLDHNSTIKEEYYIKELKAKIDLNTEF